MAKKKPKKQPFYVQGMTTKEILEITPDVLEAMSERDLSRALRTVALAANKRIRRLQKAIEQSKPVVRDAIQWLSETNSGKVPTFGVKQAVNKSAMVNQIRTIRQLWNMKESTVSGALTVKQRRERMLFGATRQELAAGMSKKDRANFYKRLNRRYDKTWEFYHKYQEFHDRDIHALWDDSAKVLNIIGKMVLKGERNEEKIMEAALRAEKNLYEEEQETDNNLFNGFDFWSV